MQSLTNSQGTEHGDQKHSRFPITVDSSKYVVERPTILGSEILALAKRQSKDYLLTQLMAEGPPRVIEPDHSVNLREPGIERFVTLKRQQTDGRERREFTLPARDLVVLAQFGERWETVREGADRWLRISDWPVPCGYRQTVVTLGLLVPPSYPNQGFDMAYFDPPLERSDGKPINAVTPRPCAGRSFQQWSRHRLPTDPWRPDVDGVGTELLRVTEFVRVEVER